MQEIRWYFPKTLEEVTGLLQEEGIIPHGGGTSILKGGMKRVKGLIDSRRLDLSYFRTAKGAKGMIEIGATCTYSEVVERQFQDSESNNRMMQSARICYDSCEA